MRKYRIHLIIIALQLILFNQRTKAFSFLDKKDSTIIYSIHDTIIYFEKRMGLEREFILKSKFEEIDSKTILKCSACGGKIIEALDTVILTNGRITILQSTDNNRDTILFIRLRGVYTLDYFSRHFYDSNTTWKMRRLKGIRLRDFNYEVFIDDKWFRKRSFKI